jgi:hypothetical protein
MPSRVSRPHCDDGRYRFRLLHLPDGRYSPRRRSFRSAPSQRLLRGVEHALKLPRVERIAALRQSLARGREVEPCRVAVGLAGEPVALHLEHVGGDGIVCPPCTARGCVAILGQQRVDDQAGDSRLLAGLARRRLRERLSGLPAALRERPARAVARADEQVLLISIAPANADRCSDLRDRNRLSEPAEGPAQPPAERSPQDQSGSAAAASAAAPSPSAARRPMRPRLITRATSRPVMRP